MLNKLMITNYDTKITWINLFGNDLPHNKG